MILLRCPCGNTVNISDPYPTGFQYGPSEAFLAYHWGCAEKLGVPRPLNKIQKAVKSMSDEWNKSSGEFSQGKMDDLVRDVVNLVLPNTVMEQLEKSPVVLTPRPIADNPQTPT